MGQKAQDIINNLKAQKKAEYENRKNEKLIELNMYEEVRSSNDAWDNEYPFSGFDQTEQKYYYYKKVAIEMSDEEFEEILSLSNENPSYDNQNKNGVSITLLVIGVLIYCAGFIAGIVMGAPESSYYSSDEFNFTTMFTAWTSAFISGTIFIAFSEIIKLLHQIKTKK